MLFFQPLKKINAIKTVLFRAVSSFFLVNYIFLPSILFARDPRVVYIDPKKRFLVIEKPPESNEYSKGSRVCLFSRAHFFLSCSAVVVSNRTKAALVLSKIDMENVKIGMAAEVKGLFIKKDDPTKGPQFVPIDVEQQRLATNKAQFEKFLEKGQKGNSNFLAEIENALKSGSSEEDAITSENYDFKDKTHPNSATKGAATDANRDKLKEGDSGDTLNNSSSPNNSENGAGNAKEKNSKDEDKSESSGKKSKKDMERQEKLKKAVEKLTGGATLDELANAGWLAGLTKEEPLEPISKKELKAMQKDMGPKYLKTGDREFLAMDLWDKKLPPQDIPPINVEKVEPDDSKGEESSPPVEEKKESLPLNEDSDTFDPLAQIQKIFVLPPPKMQKKSVRIDLLSIWQPMSPASTSSLGFKKLEQAEIIRDTLWQKKDTIKKASTSFGIQMVMTRAYKNIYSLGYRTTFFQKKEFQTDYDANDYSYYAKSETKFSASGSWFDYGRKMGITPFLYSVAKVGIDLDSSIADFKSLRGNDALEDHHLIAYGNSKLTLVSLRLGIDLGFHYWGFGFVGGVNALVPFYNARKEFNGGVSVPENITILGDPLEDLKKSLDHKSARYASEVYLGVSYEPY